MSTHPLRIMTFNMANYDDHYGWATRAKLITEIVATHQPDVIMFQEVRFNPDEGTTAVTYQDMGQQVLYGLQVQGKYLQANIFTLPIASIPFYSYTVPIPQKLAGDGRTHEWEGISVIAQQFVTETGATILSYPGQFLEDLNPRATQFLCIDLLNGRGPGGQQQLLYIFNTHFAYAIPDAVGNSKKTLEYMEKKTNYNTDLVVLAGDLNCEPGSSPIELIDNTLLKDLWTYMWGNTQPGLTYPASAPTKRIDYIFASPPLAKLCTAITLIGNQPSGNVYASDHFGLLATFDIEVADQPTSAERDLEKSFFFI